MKNKIVIFLRQSHKLILIISISSIIPLFLSSLPTDFIYIPIIGTAVAIVLVIYTVPILLIGNIIHETLVVGGQGSAPSYSWHPAGALFAIVFWLAISVTVAFFLANRKSRLTKSEIENQERRRRLDNEKFRFLIIILIALTALAYAYLELWTR